MEYTEILRKLTKLKENLQDLTEEEAYTFWEHFLSNGLSDVKKSAFLTAMRIKGETPEELLGIIKATKKFMKFPEEKKKALDLGLNYDGKDRTIYILPSAVWMASEFGIEFTNHYALKVPTKEGVTFYEVMKKLGFPGKVSFVSQREYSPKLYALMPLRRELGFRSLINTIEKLLNPFRAKRLVVSIFHKPYFEKTEVLLKLLGYENYTIIKGVEGGIEPLPDRPTFLKRACGDIEKIEPKELGLELPKDVSTEDVLGSSVEINKAIIEGKERGAFFNWAVYTASILLYAYGVVESVEEGIKRLMAHFLQ